MAKAYKIPSWFFLFSVCWSACSSPPNSIEPTAVFGADGVVKRGIIERLVTVDGQLYSPSSRPLAIPQISWYWEWGIAWAAEEGSLVKADEVVVKLDTSQIKKDLTQRTATAEQQRLELEEDRIRVADEIADAKNSVLMAELDLKKKKLLVTNSDAVSESEKRRQQLDVAAAVSSLARAMERVTSTIARTQRRLEATKLKLDQAEESLAQTKDAVSRTELKAPQDGLLILPQYSYSSGWTKARAGGGANTGTEIAEVANPKDLVARVYVPEIDADGIKVGIPSAVQLDVAPGEIYSGKVRLLSSMPSTRGEREGKQSLRPADNIRQFEVQVELAELPKLAMPGMTVQVTLQPIRKENVLMVPTEALASAPVTDKPQKSTQNVAATASSDQALATADVVESPSPLASGAPAESAWIYARGKDDKKWSWRQLRLGVQSLTHAEVVEGLSEGDQFKTLLW